MLMLCEPTQYSSAVESGQGRALKLSVLLCTHQVVLGQLLAASLARVSGFGPVRFVVARKVALKAVRDRHWDVALLDAGTPTEDSFAIARAIRRRLNRTRVLFFADSAPLGWIARALEAGACGFLGKCASVEDFERAIRAAASGQAYYTPCAAKLMSELASRETDLPVFTVRERSVLHLICEGDSSKEMARTLRMSVKGVEAVRSRLMKKAGTRSSAGLVKYACNERLVDPRPEFEAGEAPRRRHIGGGGRHGTRNVTP